MRISILFVLCFLVLVSCDSDAPTAPFDSDYPTTYHLLYQGELETLRAEYARENPRLCTSLDDYGFPEGSCIAESQGVPEDPDVDSYVATAKAFLRKNSKYTGVRWNDELVVRRVTHSRTLFLVDFENQRFKGLSVEQTPISIVMDSKGVLGLHGHHYPGAVLPDTEHSSADAQQSVLGLGISYYNMDGQLVLFVVSHEDLVEDPVRVILPHTTFFGIELRVAWRVPVRSGWWVYVDSMTNERLLVRQLFVS